jgi:hypothetical protein
LLQNKPGPQGAVPTFVQLSPNPETPTGVQLPLEQYSPGSHPWFSTHEAPSPDLNVQVPHSALASLQYPLTHCALSPHALPVDSDPGPATHSGGAYAQ